MNLEVRHIARTNNAMVDMLSRARYEDENNMVSEDEDVTLKISKTTQAYAETRDMQVLNAFNEGEYDGEWLHLGKFMGSNDGDASSTKEEAQWICKKAYKYFLQRWYL